MMSLIKTTLKALLLSTSLFTCHKVRGSIGVHDDTGTMDEYVFASGGPLYGGSNGMSIDNDDILYVGHVIANRITSVDTKSGEIVNIITPPTPEGGGGFMYADDLTVHADGTIYFTETIGGSVGKVNKNGTNYELLYPLGTFPNANPIAFDDTYERLFFSQCFADNTTTGVYQYNLVTNETKTIVDGIPVCASNSMQYIDGFLYAPRFFEGRVVKIDLAANNSYEQTDVVTGLIAPVAVKANNKGELFVVDQGEGVVYKILDYENPTSVTTNVELFATPPFKSIDNIIFDSNDTMYISSFATGGIEQKETVSTTIAGTETRTVVPGSFGQIYSMVQMGDTIFGVYYMGLFGFDVETGERTLAYEPAFDMGQLELVSCIVEYQDDTVLLLSSWSGTVQLFDLATPETTINIFTGHGFLAPIDALRFAVGGGGEGDEEEEEEDGFLLTEGGTGNLLYVTGNEMENRQVIMNMQGLSYLAGNNKKDVYGTNPFSGDILQLYQNGNLLDPPKVIASNLMFPEGIALVDDTDIAVDPHLVVVETGAGNLTIVNLVDGSTETFLHGLSFQAPTNVLPFGYPNDVLVAGGFAYIALDIDNKILKVPLPRMMGEGGPSPDKGQEEQRSASFDETLTEEDTSASWSMSSGLIGFVFDIVATAMML